LRLTCLKCGHQFDVANGPGGQTIGCVCGMQFEAPEVLNTGVQPSEHAAERLRRKAFRAAGLVRNVGGFALGISALGVLFFPLGLLGAAIGIYCVTMVRGPLGRYSGRNLAIAAITLGVAAFATEGALATSYLLDRREAERLMIQQSVREDLKELRRAQIYYHAANERYGDFKDVAFEPKAGHYTIYLTRDSWVAATVDGAEKVYPLPEGFEPSVDVESYRAVAVANLDGDPELDIWTLSAGEAPTHAVDDLAELHADGTPAGEDDGAETNDDVADDAVANPEGSAGGSAGEPADEEAAGR